MTTDPRPWACERIGAHDHGPIEPDRQLLIIAIVELSHRADGYRRDALSGKYSDPAPFEAAAETVERVRAHLSSLIP